VSATGHKRTLTGKAILVLESVKGRYRTLAATPIECTATEFRIVAIVSRSSYRNVPLALVASHIKRTSWRSKREIMEACDNGKVAGTQIRNY
jgi:hypothetical protein